MVREFDWRYFFDQIEFDRDAIGGGIGLIGEIMFGENAGLSQQPATHLTVQVAKAQTDERERKEFYYLDQSPSSSRADSTPRSRARAPSPAPPASDRLTP